MPLLRWEGWDCEGCDGVLRGVVTGRRVKCWEGEKCDRSAVRGVVRVTER